VILSPSAETTWLKQDAPLANITSLLHPYPVQYMNAYPVSSAVKSGKLHDRSLVEPIGERIYPEYMVGIKKDTVLQGMGAAKRNEPGAQTPGAGSDS